MMKGPLVAVLALCAFASAAMAEDRQVTVASGQEAVVGSMGFFNRAACNSIPARATLTRKPQHGTVTFRVISSALQKQFAELNNAGVCEGKRVNERAVVYRSNPGYRGTDSFTVRFDLDPRDSLWVNAQTQTFSITVR